MTENLEDYVSEEFLPPDQAQIEWLLNLSQFLRQYEGDQRFTFDEQNVMSLCSRQIVRLLSMTMAGFHLYTEWREIAFNLKSEIENVVGNFSLHGGKLTMSHFPSLDFEAQLGIEEDF